MKAYQKKGVLLLALLLAVSGCGRTQSNQTEDKNITLLDPAGAADDYEIAAYHNLYRTTTYPAVVCPTILKEYELQEGIQFSNYLVYPNQQVSVGMPLVSGETKDLDEQIKSLEEEIEDMETAHQDYVEEATEKLDEPRKNKEFYYGLTVEYAGREPEFTLWGTKYQDVAIEVKKMETELQNNTELYELDHAYKSEQLQKLKEQRQERVLTADVAGTVLGMKEFQYGDSIEPYTLMLAVGDSQSKEIKCDFISKTDINLAQRVYAFFGGKTYEVEYEPMSNQEYSAHVAKDEKIYSVFHIRSETDELQMGERGAVTVVHQAKDNVLSIMKKSIQKDADGSYVYVLQGEERVRVPVVTGMEDSVYTEILSGISAGDKVLTNEMLKATADTATVTMGNLYTSLNSTGRFYYPEYTIVKSKVKYADCYLQETLADQFQPVKAGDVLATVQVTPADNELQRKELELTRQQERLADLQSEHQKETDIKKKKELQRSITKKQREIDKLNTKIEEMQSDYEATQIKAPFDGIVIWTSECKKDEKLAYETPLFRIASYDQCFLQVKDERHILQYGDKVSVQFTDTQNQQQTTEGTVVSAGPSVVSEQLTSDQVTVQLPSEVVQRMSISTANSNGTWNQVVVDIFAEIPLMEQVLTVPKKYVVMMQRQTYVRVVEEDGHVHYQSIVTCGMDRNNYGVIEGLTEGTVVCCE